MYNPTQYDPSQIYGAAGFNPYAVQQQPQQTSASPMVQQLNPQQPTPQQKLAMALMQQSQQGGQRGPQNAAGQVSPLAGLSQFGNVFLGGMGGGL